MKTVEKIERKLPVLKTRKRVAAYARVSMESERMQHSLSAQVSYYSALIQKNPEWEYAGVFADYGISGTGTKKREEFNRMLAECEAGSIDIILTKSIQRFARNTVDLLNTVRHLKDLGIEVRFEKENINSLSGDGELMLSILASFAQEESRSISENVTWGQRKRFAERRCLRGGAAGIAAAKKARPPAQQPALFFRENLLWLLRQRVRQQGLAFQRQMSPHRLAMQRPVRQRNWMPSAAPERTDD